MAIGTFMKRTLIATVTFLTVWATLQGVAQTNTANVQWNVADFGLVPQSVRRVTWTPLEPFVDYNGRTLVPVPKGGQTDAGGAVTFSNVVSGYSYKVQIDTPFSSLVRTCGIPASVTGTINGYLYSGKQDRQNFYYLYPNYASFSNGITAFDATNIAFAKANAAYQAATNLSLAASNSLYAQINMSSNGVTAVAVTNIATAQANTAVSAASNALFSLIGSSTNSGSTFWGTAGNAIYPSGATGSGNGWVGTINTIYPQ